MQRLALKRDRTTIATILAVDIEAAEVDALFQQRWRLSRGCLAFGDFTHALTTDIVDIVGGFRGATVADYLLSRGLYHVPVVPLHKWQVGHIEHIAVNVVDIGRFGGTIANLCAGQAVAKLAWF